MTTNKFGALAANVSETFKVTIIDPSTDQPLKDKNDKEAYVEVLSSDSKEGRAFDKQRRTTQQQRAMRGGNRLLAQSDPLDDEQAKLAHLTKGWHLVDPATLEPIDVPCSEQNALELFTADGMQWLYRQVWLGANETANFIKRPSRP